MKNIYKLCILALTLTMVTSCDDGFDELNKSKTSATAVDPSFILNNAILGSSIPSGTLNYDLGIVQQIITSNSGVLSGANYNSYNPDNAQIIWQNYYRNVIKYTDNVIASTKADATRSNLYNMARIIQANAFLIITDTYGNVPYTEAGGGYSSQIFFPKYDTQESIFPKLIKEFKEASTALSVAGKVESADILYGGNIVKWKKFGYSLLLRAGMRLSKRDPAPAQAAVLDAFNGGVITDNADNAGIKHDANYANPIGNTLNGNEAANYYLTEPFVNALKNNSDPRLTAIAVRYIGATSGVDQANQIKAGTGSILASDQIGMPMGSDDVTAQAAAVTLKIGNRYAFSQADRSRSVGKLSPMYLVTAGQTNLLLAEARFRNWITTGTVAQYFDTGIKAHMNQMVTYSSGSAVSSADRDKYAAARAALLAGKELQEINYEYWIASFLNGPETWANFRRSGFPVLAPNPYPGKTVTWITRLPFPSSEILVNGVKVQEAIAAMGGDKLDIKVWWDK
jgi:hypothetical protein